MIRARLVPILWIPVASLLLVRLVQGQSRQNAAQSVMDNAKAICSIRGSGGGLVVTCPRDIAPEQRLGFVAAVADADAVLSGRASHRLPSNGRNPIRRS